MNIKASLTIIFILLVNSILYGEYTYSFPKDTSSSVVKLSFNQLTNSSVLLNKNETRIIDFGAGMAVWYKSDQPQMENLKYPIHAFVEYGNSKKNYSFFADFSFLTQFVQYDFVLKPLYLNLNLKYSIFKGLNYSLANSDLFALLGPGLWYASLTERGYPGIVDYEHKVEKDFGSRLNTGLGVSYRFKKIKISALFRYETGQGQYYAGQFEKQKVSTGSYQAIVLVSYGIFSKKYALHCPAYQ